MAGEDERKRIEAAAALNMIARRTFGCRADDLTPEQAKLILSAVQAIWWTFKGDTDKLLEESNFEL